MVQRPDTKYVEVGDADVAYQVIGDGPNDVLYFYGLGSHVEVQWNMADFVRFIERLLPFSRVIVFDRRGTGASDGIVRSALPTCEEWTEDVLAVLDAVGSTQTAIIATLDAGQVAMLFAAQHPERVSALPVPQCDGALLPRRRPPDRGDARGGRCRHRLPAIHLGNRRVRPGDQPRPDR